MKIHVVKKPRSVACFYNIWQQSTSRHNSELIFDCATWAVLLNMASYSIVHNIDISIEYCLLQPKLSIPALFWLNQIMEKHKITTFLITGQPGEQNVELM